MGGGRVGREKVVRVLLSREKKIMFMQVEVSFGLKKRQMRVKLLGRTKKTHHDSLRVTKYYEIDSFTCSLDFLLVGVVSI